MAKFLKLILLIFIFSDVGGQVPVERSYEISIINGKKYFLHKVEVGQTLYSLSIAYNVSQKDISKSNNIFTAKIISGQILKIPAVAEGQADAVDYFAHEIKKNETLKSIAEKYEISEKDIILHNPAVEYGLKKGMIINIPNVRKGNFDFQDKNYFYHTILSEQTLFLIAQIYGTTIEQIKLINPKIKNDLNVGEILKIPKVNYDSTERLPVFIDLSPDPVYQRYDELYFEDKDVIPCNRFIYDASKKFNIAIMLPLFLEENIKSSENYRNKDDKLFYKNTRRFYEFYEGTLIAIKQLQKQGLSLNVYVYDTKNSPEKVKEIINEIEYMEIDLIIGPVYSKNVKIAGNFAKKNRINLISPLSKNSEVLKNNPFVFEVVPSTEMKIKKTSDLLSRLYDTCIVILHNNSKEEKNKINIYKKKLVKSFSNRIDIDEVVLKSINYKNGGLETVERTLSVGLKNTIIMPSDDEVFITEVIEKLDTLTENYEIMLIGDLSWELFQNINLGHLVSLSFHYVSTVHIDYENWRVKNFIEEYRNIYKTEPSIYSYEGYDIANYFLNSLKKYGKHFQFCLSPLDKIPNRKGIVFDFNFERTGINNGFENNGIHILQYDKNFKLKKADINY